MSQRVRLRLAESVGLRLTSGLGHCFGEIREEHGEPEPERELKREAEAAMSLHDVAHQNAGGKHAPQ